MNKDIVLTGLRANNALHIGNYLGALLPMIDMAREKSDQYQINVFIPDLHSFTTPVDHNTLQAGIMNTVRLYVALGLPIEHPDVHAYRQSYISAHSELMWILSCFTGFGEMQRMTQFKEKSTQSGGIASIGLFNYPILMAADILLYGAKYVPVGDDQTQHLEFTRDIAQRINNKFGDIFTVPEDVKAQHALFGKDQGLRIRDLVNPEKKMSKSDETGKGVIFLTDTPTIARKKIMSATTDSLEKIIHDFDTQPGVSNLLDVLDLFGGNSSDFIGQPQYGPLKTAVADVVCEFLEDIQKKYEAVDMDSLSQALESSETIMRSHADKTLRSLQQAIGFRP
ncbi:tryptophan--tRNA ligase [soil metagenome]